MVVLRCFLHGWLSIRDGCKKHPLFAMLSEKVWHAYRAADRRAFAQRLRRLREWAEGALSGEILERTLRLCDRASEYGKAYEHPDQAEAGQADGDSQRHGWNRGSR